VGGHAASTRSVHQPVLPHESPSPTNSPPPAGRSLNHCRFIFEELRRTQPPTVVPGPYGPQTPLSAPPVGFKRPFSVEAPYQGGREIRPKPFPPPGLSGHITSGEPAPKRKRGRPTKAQAQAKAAAAEAASQLGSAPPPHTSSPQSAPPAVSDTPAPPEEAKPSHPPVTKMPISAVLTPSAPKTASSSGSSSGKRRRTRSTRSEPEGYPMGGGGGIVGLSQDYESPYAMEARSVMEMTPARSTIMRHREERGLEPDPFLPPPIETRMEPPLPPPPPPPAGNQAAPGGSQRPGI